MNIIMKPEVEQHTNELIKLIHHFKSSLSYYTDRDFEKTFGDEGWSMSQLYDHLYESSKNWFGYKIKNCLNKEKGTTEGSLTEEGKLILGRGYITNTKKIKMPDSAQPPQSRPKSYFKEVLTEYPAEVQELSNRIQQDSENDFRTKHFSFGMLTAEEWLKADLIHWKHHLRQQEEIEGKLVKG